jgi:hypothetical protein
VAQGVDEDARLLRFAVCRQVAGEEHEIDVAGEGAERLFDLRPARGRAVDIPGCGDANRRHGVPILPVGTFRLETPRDG